MYTPQIYIDENEDEVGDDDENHDLNESNKTISIQRIPQNFQF